MFRFRGGLCGALLSCFAVGVVSAAEPAPVAPAPAAALPKAPAAALQKPAAALQKPAAALRKTPGGKEHVYKEIEGRKLRLWVAAPAGAEDKRPAIVFFHGGGWTGGNPTQFEPQAGPLVERGAVCVQVEYRLLSGAEKGEPPLKCIRDAKSAIRWVRSHAAELGIDPQNITAAGGSAGGHLAACTALIEGLDDPLDDASVSAKPNALVLFNPVLDNGPDDGWGTGRVGERYREFSPAHNVARGAPPTIMFLGTKDKLIPVAVLERFRDKMKDAGSTCELKTYADQPHGFFNQEPFLTQTLDETIRFLTEQGKLKAPAKP